MYRHNTICACDTGILVVVSTLQYPPTLLLLLYLVEVLAVEGVDVAGGHHPRIFQGHLEQRVAAL